MYRHTPRPEGGAYQRQARCRSTSGQQPGEVEPVGAGGAGGLEVGAGPVAGLGQRGVLAAGLGAVAVVLVVGQEPGQVAERRRRCRRRVEQRPSQSAQRVGPWARGRRGAARISAAFRGSKRRAASAFSRIWSVLRIETQQAADPLVGPDRVQEALERGQLLLGEHRHPADHVVEDVPLGPSPKNWPAICFIEIRPIPLLGRRRAPCSAGSPCRARGCTGA